MAIGSKVSGDFKSASGLFAKVDGGWKKAKFAYVKVAGEWKQFWADKLEDAFDRTDTTSGLGAATSGQAWTILRSQWQINSNNAKTTGAKADYPLANIELGFQDFDLEANELAPGMGVALRVTDANNWWAVMPYYNQTSTAYTYCVTGYNQSYCINPEQCYYQEAICYGGTYQVPYDGYCDDCCNFYTDCYWDNQPICKDVTSVQCYNEPRTTCEWVYYPFSGVRKVCTTQSTRICDTVVTTVCTDNWVYACADFCDTANPCCYPGGYDTYCYDQDPNNGLNGYSLYYPTACGCSSGNPQYGSSFVCTQSAVGYTYNNFYYIRVVKMENGALSVVSDTPVNERWSGLKIQASATNLNITAYSDSTYLNTVGTATVTNFTALGGGYGIAAIPSNFEDGRTIGSLKIKPLGQ